MQNLDSAAFNQAMMDKYGTVEMKRIGLNNSAAEKRQEIRPIEQAKIDFIEDADTIALAGQNEESRLTGYDSYETYHKGQLEDPNKGPATRRRLDRQKARYSQEFNKPLEQVTDNDIYKQGAREGLMALHETVKAPGDASWTPGEISEEWYTDKGGSNPAQLGSRENPLGIDVNVRQSGTGKYGRHLTEAFNPNSDQNINQTMTNQYNPAIYKKNGKFDKQASNRAGLMHEYGLPANATKEQIGQAIMGGGDNDGMLGESIDIAQSGIAKLSADGLNAMEKFVGEDNIKAYDEWAGRVEKFFGGDGKVGMIMDTDGNFKSDNLLGMEGNVYDARDAKVADEKFGVKKATRAEQNAVHAQAQKEMSEGNWGAAAGSMLSILPYMLGDSAAETALLMIPYVGLTTAVGIRTSNNTEEFIKNNGREPTTEEFAKIVAGSAVVLGAEKFLVKAGIKNVLGTNIKAGKKLKRAGAVAGSTLGEAVQEGADFTQEKYTTQEVGKESLLDIATSPEAQLSALAGGVMGGALSGTGQAAGAAVSLPGEAVQAMKNKRERDLGEYLVDEDGKLGKAFDDMTFKATTEFKADTKEAVGLVENINSFEEAINSPNQTIKRIAQGLSEINDDKDVEVGSERHLKNIAMYIEDAIKGGKDLSVLDAQLGINVNESGKKEITDAIFAMSKENRDTFLEGIPPDTVNRTAAQKLEDTGGFAKYKQNLIDTVNANDKAADMKVDEMNSQLKHVEKGRKRTPKEIKEGKIDTGKIAKAEPTGIIGTAVNILSMIPTLTTTSRKNAMKELNKYSDASLDEASKSKDTPRAIKSYVDAVISKRRKAKELGQIDTKEDFSPRNTDKTLYKGDKKLTLDTLKKGLSKKEYGDVRDVRAMENLVNSALKQDFITERQHEIFHKRLKKIGDKAVEPTEAELKEEAETDEKFGKNTGFGKKTMENLKSEEVSKPDLVEEVEELFTKHHEIVNSDEYKRIKNIAEEERSKEDSKAFEELEKKIDSIKMRLGELKYVNKNFSQHETDMNDAYTSMEEEWFYKEAQVYNVENAFTDLEKEILGIC